MYRFNGAFDRQDALFFNRFYTSFFRENKPLRYYTNPTFCLYSTGKYIYNTFYKKETTLKQIGLDAKKSGRRGTKINDCGGWRSGTRQSFFTEWVWATNQSIIAKRRYY